MTKSKKFTDAVVLGFALFSMLFGAGNLIFPAYLGVNSASHWTSSFVCFILADVGIALVCIFALLKNKNSSAAITGKIGRIPDIILNTAIILCLGPLLAIPRTAATTYEIFVKPNFSFCNSWVFSVIFFGIVVLLTIKPGKVVDIVGMVLTPILLIGLGVLIVNGIINPTDAVQASAITAAASMKDGISTGYQTMDAMGILALSSVLLTSLTQKGYTTEREKSSMLKKAAFIAACGLFFVYGGLTFLGATSSSLFAAGMSQTDFLMLISNNLLGSSSSMLLGVIVAAACLTTAIGLLSASAQFFCDLSKGKLGYKTVTVFIAVFSLLFSNIGLSSIISIAAPILSLVYPVILTLVVLSFFNKMIKNQYVYKGAAIGALLTSVLTVVSTYIFELNFIKFIPFNSIGFEWILPACAGGLIGACLKKRETKAPNSDGSVTTITFALPFGHPVQR